MQKVGERLTFDVSFLQKVKESPLIKKKKYSLENPFPYH